MSNRRLSLADNALLVLFACLALANSADADPGGIPHRAGEVIIKFKANATPHEKNQLRAELKGNRIKGWGRIKAELRRIEDLSVEEAGTQTITQKEPAIFFQDNWKPRPNVTVQYGIRWEELDNPDLITPIDELFYAPFIGQTVTTAAGPQEFPGNGTTVKPTSW